MKIISDLRKFLSPRQGKRGYEYQKGKASRWKMIYIVVLAIIIVFGVSFVGSITGYAVRTGDFLGWISDLEGDVSDLESQLSEAQDRISILTDEKDSCSNELNETKSKALECENDFLDIETKFSECKEQRKDTEENLNLCIEEKVDITETLEEEMENYQDLVRSSVQARCCSVSDINTGAIKKWDIVTKEIICSDLGEYKVDCKTGETDY